MHTVFVQSHIIPVSLCTPYYTSSYLYTYIYPHGHICIYLSYITCTSNHIIIIQYRISMHIHIYSYHIFKSHTHISISYICISYITYTCHIVPVYFYQYHYCHAFTACTCFFPFRLLLYIGVYNACMPHIH